MRVNYNSDISAIISDVGLRRTCAYYRTSARAMCLRKCVRKGFGTVREEVRAYGHMYFELRFAMALFTLF